MTNEYNYSWENIAIVVGGKMKTKTDGKVN